MPLPILDGNQSATTLSTIFTSGAHIPAHTVVSLGAQAISDISSAVSGISVSIGGTQTTTFGAVSVSNFPSTQTIAGTVTIGNSVTANSPTRSWIDNSSNPQSAQFFPVAFDYANNQLAPIPVSDGGFGVIAVQPTGINWNISGTVTANLASANLNSVTIGVRGSVTLGAGTSQIGSVTVSNSVTIGSLPAISGTVTANLSESIIEPVDSTNATQVIAVHIKDADGNTWGAENIFPVVASGTVTVGNSVTISALPSGALTTRFGSVTTANTAQITSAVTNTSRKYLLAQNISAGTVTIGIGFSPTTTQGIQLTAGGGLTFDAFCPTGAVYWLGAVTGAAFTILEG